MKSKLILFTILSLGLASQVKAQNTDVSQYDNVIYVEPMEVESGTEAQLSIQMNNTVPFIGIQYEVNLPEGLEFVTDEDGYAVAEVSEARTTKKLMDGVTTGKPKNGMVRITAWSNRLQDFSGNTGEVMKVSIKIPSTTVVGQYAVKITGTVFSNQQSQAVYQNDAVTSLVTVTGPAFDGVILDENSTTAPAASDGTVNVKVLRTLKANTWSTLCLPFAMTGEQVASAFGSDVKIGDLSGCTPNYASEDDDNPESIEATFKTVAVSDGLKANHPYIIRTAKDISDFTVEGVTIAPADATISGGSARKTTNWTFTGNYVAGTVVPKENLFLKNNQFWYSVGKTTIKAFRGYFELSVPTKYYLDETASNAKVNIVMEDNATGINSHKAEPQKGLVYTLSGTVVGKDVKALPHGVYIVNGKKIVK